MSDNSTQRQAESIESNQQAANEQTQQMSTKHTGYHYVKHHGYSIEDFAEDGETTQFNGIRVIDGSKSSESEEFENFTELNSSDWKINTASVARLNDGTILYEGSQ